MLQMQSAFLLSLAEHGIPPDVQELLCHGDGRGTIAPGALDKAFTSALAALKSSGLAIVRQSDVFAIGRLSEISGSRTLGEASDNLMQVNSYCRAMIAMIGKV